MKETAMYFYIWNCFQGGSNGCFFKEFRTFAPGTYIHIISGGAKDRGIKVIGGKSPTYNFSEANVREAKVPGAKVRIPWKLIKLSSSWCLDSCLLAECLDLSVFEYRKR